MKHKKETVSTFDKYTSKSASVESLKELLRIMVLTLVAYLLTEGVLINLVESISGNRLDPTQKLMFTGVMGALLRGIDKFLHENKDVNIYGDSGTKDSGLLPF